MIKATIWLSSPLCQGCVVLYPAHDMITLAAMMKLKSCSNQMQSWLCCHVNWMVCSKLNLATFVINQKMCWTRVLELLLIMRFPGLFGLMGGALTTNLFNETTPVTKPSSWLLTLGWTTTCVKCCLVHVFNNNNTLGWTATGFSKSNSWCPRPNGNWATQTASDNNTNNKHLIAHWHPWPNGN